MRKNMKKSRRMVNVICGLFVMSIVCTGAAYDVTGTDVTITEIDEIHDVENILTVRTRQESIGEIIRDNGFEVGLYDKVNYEDHHVAEGGEDIVIRRGVGITIEIDGTIVTTSATSKTVGEALVENGFFINELDYTIPSADSLITPNQVIKVVRVENQTVEREETIPYETVYKSDSSIFEGTSKVLTHGVDGKVLITEAVVTENGSEVSRQELSREVITEKVDKVVAKGTKKRSYSSGASAKTTSARKSDIGFSYSKKMTMTATAYSAFKKDGSYGITASGRVARYGIVAVDPKVIPLGTELYVEGYGYAVAGDTGGVIKGNKIDLCFEKPNKELMAFGRKQLTVYILN